MKKRLYIGMACYDGKLMATTFISLMNFLGSGSPELSAPPYVNILTGESHVNRVRNRIAKGFMDTDCTHLLMLDSDIVFKPEDITALLKREAPIVGGLYSKKEAGQPQWVVNALDGGSEPDETGLQEVKYIGTGFMLIAREVFENMITECEAISYEDDSGARMGTMWNFFHAGIKPGCKRWLSEDWWFCQTWAEMGGEIYADTRVQLGHNGSATFPILAAQPDLGSGL